MPETIGYARPKKIRKTLSKDMENKLKGAIARLKLGQDYRQKEREEIWRDSMAQYVAHNRWTSYSTEDTTADLVSINISFSTINTILPFVSDEDPTFLIEPDSEEATDENAIILGTFMNRIWRAVEVQGKLALSDATFDHLVLGDGFLKVGYEIVNVPTYDENGNVIGAGRVEKAEFSVDRINPWDVWLDPQADGMHNARWVCHRMLVPKSEIESDDRYKVSDNDEFEGANIDQMNLSPEDQERIDYLAEGWVAVYEFYDLKERWMLTFLSGGTQAIRYIEQVECPIIQLPNYRLPNSPWHMGELEQISSLQDEINKTRSQMMTHRRRNVMKWVVAENRITDDALEAMKSSIVNDVIKVETNEPLDSVIQPIAPAALSADIYAIDDRLRADVNEITGVNEYLRGVPQNISRTATEASIIEGATNIRTRHKLLQIETAAQQAGQMLLNIIRDVLPLTDFQEMTMFVSGKDAERLNRVSGLPPQNGSVLLTPNPEVFQGHYLVKVERGSTELRNPQAKAQQLMQMVQMMASLLPVLQQQQIAFNMKALLEDWFKAEGIKDIEKYFELDQNQQQMMDLALQERQNQAAGAAGPTGGLGGPGNAAPGTPNRMNAQPPSQMINPSNSGMAPSRQY